MPVLPDGILGQVLSTGGLGLLIWFLWRQVAELKTERAAAWAALDLKRTKSDERITALCVAHEVAQRELEQKHKATLNKLERQHVITLQALAEAKDIEIANARTELLQETRRRLEDKANYERQFTATAKRIERLLLEWQAAHGTGKQ